jgi:hypothetical protein
VTTIQDCIAVVDRCTASLQAATDRLRWFEMHSMLGLEPAILPKRRAKKPVKPSAPKTQRMRRNFNEADVAFLRAHCGSTQPITALNAYRVSEGEGKENDPRDCLKPRRATICRCPCSNASQNYRRN